MTACGCLSACLQHLPSPKPLWIQRLITTSSEFRQSCAPQELQWQRIHLPVQETREARVPSLGRQDPLGKGTAAHSIQYACLGNPMDGGAWWATVHGVAELDTAELLSTRIQEKRVSIQGWRAVRLGLLTEKF